MTQNRQPNADTVPPEVIAAAAAADLGIHRSTFGKPDTGSTITFVLAGLVIAAIPAGLGLLFGTFSTGLMITGFVVAGAIALLIVMAACHPHKDHEQRRAWVFEHGFVHRHYGGQLSVFPWTEIRVLRDITRHHRNGVHTRTTYKYTIRRSNGAELVMSELSFPTANVGVLGNTIEQAVTAVRLPVALKALEQGKRLDFGDLSVDTAGISCGRSTLPWSEVEAVDTVEGQVRIKRAGAWLSWSKTPVSTIPDVMVLLMLAQALHRRGQPIP